jgi:hypothetical protein
MALSYGKFVFNFLRNHQTMGASFHIPTSSAKKCCRFGKSLLMLAVFWFCFYNSYPNGYEGYLIAVLICMSLITKYVSLLSLWQNSWGKQLEEGKIYFGSWFQRYQYMVTWLHYFWGTVRQNIIACGEGAWWGKAAQLMATRKQRVKEMGRGQGQDIPFKGMPPGLTSSN